MVKEKKTSTLTIRMTDEEKLLFQIASYQAGLTPSKLVRMLIDASVNAVRLEIQKGVIQIEDFKTLFDN